MKHFLFGVVLFCFSGIHAQSDWKKRDIVGVYTIVDTPPPPPETDSNIVRINPPGLHTDRIILVNPFSTIEYLKLRCNKRFKMKGAVCTLDIGLNEDFPSFYGTWKISGDTLVLQCEYYIQHFTKISKQGRVKKKYELVYRWIIEQDKLIVSEWLYWAKEAD